jgi:hypothetical protein
MLLVASFKETASQLPLCQSITISDELPLTDHSFPTRLQVEQHNISCLTQLKGSAYSYPAFDSICKDADGNPIPHEIGRRILQDVQAPETLILKVGPDCLYTVEQGSRNKDQGPSHAYPSECERAAHDVPTR